MKRYQLPCQSCGEINLVTTTQAGQYIDCYHCEKEVAIPRMGAIRQLDPEFEESQAELAGATGGKEWSSTKGLLFSIGLFLLVTGIGLAAKSAFTYMEAAKEVEAAGKLLNLASKEERIEKTKDLSLDQVHAAWSGLMTTGFQPWHGSRYYVECEKRDLARDWGIATGGVATVGLLLTLSIFFIKNK